MSKRILSDKELHLVHLNIEHGFELKTLLPQIAEEYRQGKTIQEIAEKYHPELQRVSSFRGISVNGLKMAIGYAIGGYDGRFHKHEPYSYEGLMPYEEYLAIRDKNWKLRSRQIVLNAGHTPFEEEEVVLIKELMRNPLYRKDLSNVVQVINETFHQGENIRTRKTLSTFLSKDKAKTRKRELQLQEA